VAAAAAVMLVGAVGLHLEPHLVAVLGLLVASLLGLIESRVSIVAGLVCIAVCPVLLIAERQAWLQQSVMVQYYACRLGVCTLHGATDIVAIWAYTLMCIGVVTRIAELALGRKRVSGEQEQSDERV
jgi:hypothetical protein